MPTHNDETLHDRYAREHADHMALLAKMTPEQIAEMELSLHNAMAELDRLRDRQTQRIGELAELAAQASVNCKNTAYYLRKYRPDLADICSGWCVAIDAALSAGKEGE